MVHKLTTYRIIGLLLVVAFLAGCISSNDAGYNNGGIGVITKDTLGWSDIYIIQDKYGNKYIYSEIGGAYGKACSITPIPNN